jgi:hypothetical protein
MNVAPAIRVRPPLLSRGRRLALYVIGLGTWLTGAVWLLFHYFFMRETAFGLSPHPLEFWSRAGHGAFAFACLFLFGMLWGAHVLEGWRSRRRRWSGSIMFAVFAWLVASGYMLYYLGNDWLISATSLAHWAVGLVCPLPFLLHRLARTGARRTAV